MSVRNDSYEVSPAHQFRQDVNTVRSSEATLKFEDLNEVERSAATIGVHPEAWKPISWLNAGHYTELLKKNALGGRLCQQIEALLGQTARRLEHIWVCLFASPLASSARDAALAYNDSRIAVFESTRNFKYYGRFQACGPTSREEEAEIKPSDAAERCGREMIIDRDAKNE